MLCMSAGWGDAAILVPYVLYKRTGDRKVLTDNYEMMQKWYAFLLGRAQQTTEEQQTGAYAKYTVLNGLDYGEWCEQGRGRSAVPRHGRKGGKGVPRRLY